MPIYAYRCESCGFQKDMLRKLSDPPLTACPECGQATFQKQVTAAGFQLKGSGWYVTDFREGGSNTGAKKPDAAAKPEAATSAGGAEGGTPSAAGESGSSAGTAAAGSSDGAAARPNAAAPTPAPVSSPSPATSGKGSPAVSKGGGGA